MKLISWWLLASGCLLTNHVAGSTDPIPVNKKVKVVTTKDSHGTEFT
eukprot:CAMPEP_0172466142 /NCGR_PEP_ID=MMETSP1065-20121228/55335_1 /TAXON_ID=265537 /ORGANISM="Amphiprora paludosa, Strain CCMP125" /LENGTH=46 /DNA_ID= /DNA_START= /DNA_END= /DNA_ORIENTATION=